MHYADLHVKRVGFDKCKRTTNKYKINMHGRLHAAQIKNSEAFGKDILDKLLDVVLLNLKLTVSSMRLL